MSLRREIIKKNNIKTTKTSQFLVPLIGYPLNYYTQYHIGSYILNDKEPKIVCVFEHVNDELLNIHLKRLSDSYCYISTMKDEDEIVVKFDLDKTFKNDFHIFLDGKYSLLSKKFKDLLMRFHDTTSAKDHYASMYDTLYPTNRKRKLLADYLSVDINDIIEVLAKPELDLELYKPINELKLQYGEKT
jgi:hypothetical protein